MSRQIIFVAHPLRPTDEEIHAIGVPSDGATEFSLREFSIRANLDRALRWLRWLRRSFPEVCFTAPWISDVLSEGTLDLDTIRAAQNFDVLERCDGLVLCGGRVSGGMKSGIERARRAFNWSGDHGFLVVDLTGHPAEPPSAQIPERWKFYIWAAPYIIRPDLEREL